MCVDVGRILGKSWWPDVCHLSQGAHTPYTRGSPERVRLTGGRACWRERGHSYRSISSYRKLPPPACPGTTCIIDSDDDEADDNAVEVDADIPADDADDQQVIDTLDEQMMDDLAEARQKRVWVRNVRRSPTVKKEAGSRAWASRACSRVPSRTVLEKADRREPSRSPSAGRRRVSFSSDVPETKFFEPTAKKRATSRTA